MAKTLEDCQKFVDVYNKMFDEGKKQFDFNIELKDGRVIERIFKVRDFKIGLNKEKKVNILVKEENKYIEEENAPFCPCKVEHIEGNICPCKDCLDEAEEKGRCHCLMYVKI